MITRKVYPFPKWYLDPPTSDQIDYAEYLSHRFKEPLPTTKTKKAYSDFIGYCKLKHHIHDYRNII